MTADSWEYGIAHRSDDLSGVVHRTNMSEIEADNWIDDWERDGGKPDAYYVIKRPRGQWQASL